MHNGYEKDISLDEIQQEFENEIYSSYQCVEKIVSISTYLINVLVCGVN